MGSKQLPGIDRNQKSNSRKNSRGGGGRGTTGRPVGSPLSQLIFLFEGDFREGGCHVVAQTQGYHLVCICGSLFKFQGVWGYFKEHVVAIGDANTKTVP